MRFDQLAEVWRAEAPEAPTRSPAEEVAAVRAKAADLERTVRRRDWRETAVALVMLPLFTWRAVSAPNPLSALGAAIVAVGCVLIPLRLRAARGPDPDPALPVAWALKAELARVRAQERLLGNMAWWYLAPLIVGCILFRAGGPESPRYKAAYAAVALAAAGVILCLNLLVVRHQLRPMADEIQRWLDDLDEPVSDGPPFDEASSPGAPDAS